MTNELVIHTSDTLTGDWKKITPSLNVCNYHHRGAGTPYSINDKVYIFTQECLPGAYGKSVYIKELVKLNSNDYEEKLVANISSEINNSDGIHTLNISENYIIYDTKRLIFSLLAPLKKLSITFFVKYRKSLFT
jgi:hypothetical protein